MSVEANGTVPEVAKDKKLGAKHMRAVKLGLWGDDLDIYNLCKLWSLMVADKTTEMSMFLPKTDAELFLDDSWLQIMSKFGHRLYPGLKRSGGIEADKGSFLWVVKTGRDLLAEKETSKLAPADTDDIVQWWFHAALTEAGRLFRSELKPDTDYSKPLSDVFLLDSPSGCMRVLESRISSRVSWTKMATNLPFIVQVLISSSSSVAQPHDGSFAWALSSLSRFRAPSFQVPKFESRKQAGGVCSWPYSLSVEGCLLSAVAQNVLVFVSLSLVAPALAAFELSIA